jgi:hypothetical protein
MFKKTIAFALILFALGGCTSQKEIDCSGRVRLVFRHTLNTSFTDRFKEEVSSMKVYIFDSSTGVLVNAVQVPQSDINQGYMDLFLPSDSEYTLVAWGGSGNDILRGGHKAVEIIDAAAHGYHDDVRIGETTLDSFRKMLEYELVTSRNADSNTAYAPTNVLFDDLFHAKTEEVSVQPFSEQSITLDFLRNTSTLRVEVAGLQYLRPQLGGAQLQVFATGANARYYTTNHICTFARQLEYQPYYREITDTEKFIDIKMQRLVIARHNNGTTPVLLYVQHPETGINLIRPFNLVQAILSVRDIHNNLVWRTQEDIDREEEFYIRISFNPYDLNVGISINGWMTDELIPEFRN